MKLITKFIENRLGQHKGYPRRILKCKIEDYEEETLKDLLKSKKISLKEYYKAIIELSEEVE